MVRRPLVRFCLFAIIVIGSVSLRGQEPSEKAVAAGAAAAEQGVVATSFDDEGTPTFLWAVADQVSMIGARPEVAARAHLQRLARALRTTNRDIADAALVRVRRVGEGGTIAHFRQRLGGIDVYGSDVRVMLRADNQLVAVAGRPRALAAAPTGTFSLSAGEALAAALGDLSGTPVAASSIATVGDASATGRVRLQLADGGPLHLPEPAAVNPVLMPFGEQMVAAYVVEFYASAADSGASAAYRYVVSATDGRVLERKDLTVSEHDRDPRGQGPAFTYRVFAGDDTRPLDGPQQDFTPHPTGIPDGSQPAFIPPSLITVSGLNNDDSHRRRPDPWLAPDGRETVGNNADAYVDHRAPDGFSAGDFRADVTGDRRFDRIYDTAVDPLASVDQSKAAITNAFYVVNWLHDYWYDSGFDEEAGNAQLDNYDRGGVDGDPIKVEVQDNYFGGFRNNANMSTPADGLSPRMQLYVFTGPTSASLTLTPGGSVPVGVAAGFGPSSFDVSAPVVLANGATTPATDACQALPAQVGRIVLVDRGGGCSFVVKAQNVQASGAVGMILANNVPGPAPGLGGTDPTIRIAVLSISLADGTALKARLLAGPVSARLFRRTDVDRDSALDNNIVSHEWGHYLHHRLAECGLKQCSAMSEGWGDFIALHTSARRGDNLRGTFALAMYSTNDPYYGIRRAPYSVDFAKNPLTFRHITDGVALPAQVLNFGANSEVHNAGEVWTSMLWEGYVALQQARGRRSFDDVRRRMADYVVAGLQLTPPDATYTEQRDAILAAATLARGDDDDDDRGRRNRGEARSDMIELAKAFARRGAGSCAVAPARGSQNFAGVVESYDLKPKIAVGTLRLEEGRRSCDRDGFLDGGERGRLVVPILNAGPIDLEDTVVTVTTSTPGVSFPRGNVVRVQRLTPFSSAEVTVDVALAATFAGDRASFEVRIANADACEQEVVRSLTTRVNVDVALAASRLDTFESPVSAWTTTGSDASSIWSRADVTPLDAAWHGIDFGGASDTQLTSPALVVGSGQPLVVTFDHRFSFEKNGADNFDGGLIEFSRDGGTTWNDVSTLMAPGYGGTLFVGSGNPLAGRQAYVGQSPGYPARTSVALNFGMAFAGQTIRLRFRIGTDAGAGDFGWELDNLRVDGTTNTPFSALVPDGGVCRVPRDRDD